MSIVFGTPETYADARISTYTNETIPVDVKGTILAKVRAGWYEPRLRPGQFVYAKDCTLWQPFNGSALADDFQRDMDKPCTIVVARAGFGTIVGLLIWSQVAPGEYHEIDWLVSDRPGLGSYLVQKVVDVAQGEANRTGELQIILTVSSGYKIAADRKDCSDVPIFNLDWYWVRMGFHVSPYSPGGHDFERRIFPL